jgi:glyoxylase-like metal-dependent hydrolase (beta-lactamase superfamily II)
VKQVRLQAALGILAALGLVTTTLLAPATASAQQAGVEVLAIAEDVYLYRSGGFQSMFIVTNEGVITTDPPSQGNLRGRQLYKLAIAAITDKPIKYAMYSHYHAHSAASTSVFADTARVVSHRLSAERIAQQNDPRATVPTEIVDPSLTLQLGGKTVEFHYTGRNDTDTNIVLYYPARRLVFANEFIPVKALPYKTLEEAYPEEWVESLRWIENNLDFDTLVTEQETLGTRATVGEVREYLTDLMGSIRALRTVGVADNSPAMVNAVRADLAAKYGGWEHFEDYLPDNIKGIIRTWGGPS